ncbi:uncharacterized protein B0I36DRAFT_431528 [Microdochium trichocladiopsis]|uniref:Uncharacterized protein n=1 Tax=Microdochium trichocladiopsis TaxID=1682393 RepID=A0A9P8Y837_9PEZI|nr:uncharacterized protein B0I36DRAFT_431528 [Microdochium trichocladiopsis]KAH7031418.1 hypothetical protein B0I36DRAFT_431528 [Microdochium trichocladiopsis]
MASSTSPPQAGIPPQQLSLPLPALTSTPQRHPDCCLSLSTTLLHIIVSQVRQALVASADPAGSCGTTPSPDGEGRRDPDDVEAEADVEREDVIASIGSGSGLLEACLQRYMDDIDDIGDSGSGDDPDSWETTIVNTAKRTARGKSRVTVQGVEVHQLSSSSWASSSSSSSPSHGRQQHGLNRYLPEQSRSYVRGTWEVWLGVVLSSDALGADESHSGGRGDGFGSVDGDGDADDDDDDDDDDDNGDDGVNNDALSAIPQRRVVVVALMFVYPRLPSLVQKYVDTVLSSRTSPSSSSSSSSSSSVKVIIYLGPRADWQDFQPCFERPPAAKEVSNKTVEVKVLEGEEAGLLEYEMMGIVYIR